MSELADFLEFHYMEALLSGESQQTAMATADRFQRHYQVYKENGLGGRDHDLELAESLKSVKDIVRDKDSASALQFAIEYLEPIEPAEEQVNLVRIGKLVREITEKYIGPNPGMLDVNVALREVGEMFIKLHRSRRG